MKTKKNRKFMRDPSPSAKGSEIIAPQLLKFKFNLSQDNISCFMSKNRGSKRVCRKTSHSETKSIKPQSKPKVQTNTMNSTFESQDARKRSQSPDIIRESSNTIISKIQQKGILCTWNDIDQPIHEVKETIPFHEQKMLWSSFQIIKEKSFASTNDYPYYHSVGSNWMISQSHMYATPMVCSYLVQPDYIQTDWRTTLMIRNIPNKYTVSQLAQEIDSQHPNTYDFLYLPCDPKICALTYARLQGLNQLIQHFENSKVLNQKEKKYRPIIKYDKIHKIVMQQQSR